MSCLLGPLRKSSVKIETIHKRLAWPLRKDDTHKSRSVNIFVKVHGMGWTAVKHTRTDCTHTNEVGHSPSLRCVFFADGAQFKKAAALPRQPPVASFRRPQQQGWNSWITLARSASPYFFVLGNNELGVSCPCALWGLGGEVHWITTYPADHVDGSPKPSRSSTRIPPPDT